MKEVAIYGLTNPDAHKRPGDQWVLNDWYQFSRIQPDRIFNLHNFPYINLTDSNRFIGDWKAEYNQTGADVITIEPIDGVDRCRVIDIERLVDLAGSRSSLSCSIATMIWMAIDEGYDFIRISGVLLNNSEHSYQATGIIKAIRAAKSRGIKVYMFPLGIFTDICKRLKTIPAMGLLISEIDLTYWEWHKKLQLKLTADNLKINEGN